MQKFPTIIIWNFIGQIGQIHLKIPKKKHFLPSFYHKKIIFAQKWWRILEVRPWGIEPQPKEPESFILSIKLWAHGVITSAKVAIFLDLTKKKE